MQKASGKPPALTACYQELLANRDVEAVIIAAPDFTHSKILLEAIQAGKDVYCENPMGTDFGEAKAAYYGVYATMASWRRPFPARPRTAKLTRCSRESP